MSVGRGVDLAYDPPRRVALAHRLGRGGSGSVYAVDGYQSLAVKIYHPGQDMAEITNRLTAMLELADADDFFARDIPGHPQLAWPEALASDANSGEVIGYAMYRVGVPDYIELKVLFVHRQRLIHVPGATWRFLLGVARNLAAVTATVHHRGLILGDVSPANFVVKRNGGFVTCLDSDSMPISDPHSGKRFPTLLTREYAAPEIQLAPGVERSHATDNFSLAILIVQTLLCGDHPFDGRREGAPESESTPDYNIRYYASWLTNRGDVKPPVGTISMEVLPPAVRQLAARCFSGASDRPTADEWVATLDNAAGSVERCSKFPSTHAYGGHLFTCPWCRRLNSGGIDPFALPPEPDRTGAGVSYPPLAATAASCAVAGLMFTRTVGALRLWDLWPSAVDAIVAALLGMAAVCGLVGAASRRPAFSLASALGLFGSLGFVLYVISGGFLWFGFGSGYNRLFSLAPVHAGFYVVIALAVAGGVIGLVGATGTNGLNASGRAASDSAHFSLLSVLLALIAAGVAGALFLKAGGLVKGWDLWLARGDAIVAGFLAIAAAAGLATAAWRNPIAPLVAVAAAVLIFTMIQAAALNTPQPFRGLDAGFFVAMVLAAIGAATATVAWVAVMRALTRGPVSRR